jgi:hypothetical protein
MRLMLAVLRVFLIWTAAINCAPAKSPCPSSVEPPSGKEIFSSVGYIGAIDGDVRQIEVRRNNRALACFEVGTLVQTGDEIVVTSERASITLNIHGQSRPIVLPDDRRSVTIGTRREPSSWSETLLELIPEPIRSYFLPDKIIALETRPRGVDFSLEALGHDPIIPLVEQRLSPAVDRVEVHWLGKAERVQLLFDARVDRTEAAPGSWVVVILGPQEREALRAIRLIGNGTSFVEWRVKAVDAAPTAPILQNNHEIGDIPELLQALWLLDLNGSASDLAPAKIEPVWRLEGLSRLAKLGERLFAAHQIIAAIRAHEIAPP